MRLKDERARILHGGMVMAIDQADAAWPAHYFIVWKKWNICVS